MTVHARPSQPRPSVLVLAGHDPSGGAGIQADIESIAYHGVHPMCVMTLTTVQNAQGVHKYYQQPLSLMQAQLDAILEERPIQAIKVGAVCDAVQVDWLVGLCKRYTDLPVVLDPVLSPSRGLDFADTCCIEAIRRKLLPHVSLLTANCSELVRLAGTETDAYGFEAAVGQLSAWGCSKLLLTSAERGSEHLIHKLFVSSTTDAISKGVSEPRLFTSALLSGEYHGSGCTLSAAIAAHLARGQDIPEAIQYSLHFVARSLRRADQVGAGQFVPRRIR